MAFHQIRVSKNVTRNGLKEESLICSGNRPSNHPLIRVRGLGQPRLLFCPVARKSVITTSSGLPLRGLVRLFQLKGVPLAPWKRQSWGLTVYVMPLTIDAY